MPILNVNTCDEGEEPSEAKVVTVGEEDVLETIQTIKPMKHSALFLLLISRKG